MDIFSLLLVISLSVAALSLSTAIIGIVSDNEPLAMFSGFILEAALFFPVFYGLVWLGNEIVKVLN